MDTKDQLAIVLKEYDALRKEIEDRVNTPKLYFVPLLFVTLAGVLGWKAEAPVDLILLFVLPLFLTFLSFALNANYYLLRAARQIAKIEDKVFRLSGQSLLTHETEMLHLRKRFNILRAVLVGAMTCTLYLIVEVWLFYELDPTILAQLERHRARTAILVALLTAPLSMSVFTAVRLVALHKANLQFRSKLLDELSSQFAGYLIGSRQAGVPADEKLDDPRGL